MNAYEAQRQLPTSVGLVPRHTNQLVCIAVLLVGATGFGTSLEPSIHALQFRTIQQHSQTSAGVLVEHSSQQQRTTAQEISFMRLTTGLTWQQIADLFNVSRQAIHAWASGAPLNSINAKHLRKLVNLIEKVNRGTISANRSILEQHFEGRSVLEMLNISSYDDQVLALVGVGGHTSHPSLPMSKAARAQRTPLKPEELVGALQDRILEEPKTYRSHKSQRVKRSGPPIG
jgi:DNA-binding transcriptional regulator YiaG